VHVVEIADSDGGPQHRPQPPNLIAWVDYEGRIRTVPQGLG